MSNQALISLDIETFQISDPACMREIETAKIINVITKNETDNIFMRNICNVLVHSLNMKIVHLTRSILPEPYYPAPYIYKIYNLNVLRAKFQNMDTTNIVLVVNNMMLQYEEIEEMKTIFNKIIILQRLYTDYYRKSFIIPFRDIANITFIDSYGDGPLDENKFIYDRCLHAIDKKKVTVQPGDILVVKPDSLKICKIERNDACYNCSHDQYSCDEILKIIKNIADNKSVFHHKNEKLYKSLWTKYYFLVQCNITWLYITNFIANSNDVLMIIFQFMIQLFKKATDTDKNI